MFRKNCKSNYRYNKDASNQNCINNTNNHVGCLSIISPLHLSLSLGVVNIDAQPIIISPVEHKAKTATPVPQPASAGGDRDDYKSNNNVAFVGGPNKPILSIRGGSVEHVEGIL